MKTVILDTNFLLIPGQFKVDIFSEIERVLLPGYSICILDKTIGELEKISREQKGKTREYVNIALGIIKQKHLKILRTSKNDSVDNIIVSLVNPDFVVATQDGLLKKRVKARGASIIVLKQKKYLYLEV